MKENTETIIAMLEELLTVSKSRQASQSGCTNMDITSIKALIEEAGRRNHERTEAELAKFAHGIVDCLNTVNNRIDRIARREQEVRADTRSVHYALPWKTSGHTAVLPMPRTVPDISMHCRLRQ